MSTSHTLDQGQLLAALLEAAPYAVVWKDRELRILGCNAAFADAVGLDSPGAAVGMTDTELSMRPAEAGALRASEMRVLGTGEALRGLAGTLTRADGRVMSVSASVLPLAGPNAALTGVLTLFEDQTGQIRARQRQVETDARFRQAVRLARLGYCLWDVATDTCVFCSDEYAANHGLPPDEYIARASTDLPSFNHPEDQQAYRDAIARLRQGEPIEITYRIVTLDGRTRHVRETAEPVFDELGAVVQEFCTIQDITEQVQAEEQLVQARKMEAIGRLTGGIAHDFNNLMQVIQGNAELLAEEIGVNRDLTAPILEATRRGTVLTRQLLAYARRQVLEPADVDLGRMVTEMTGILRRTLGEQFRIETAVPEGLWRAFADPAQVQTAILNLALNARDAMPDHGTLSIRVGNVALSDPPGDGGAGFRPGDYLLLEVSDTGAGMTPEVLRRATEPFFTTKGVGEGSGLGLSMVDGFVRQSGGHIAIDSQEGAGTTVRLYLPRSTRAATTAPPPSRPDVPAGKGELILVLEDDPAVRAMTSRALESLNYRVVEAGTAREAHAVLSRSPDVALALSDVILPGGESGPQFAAAAQSRRPGLRVVFMSGYPANDAAAPPIDDAPLLMKPFAKRALAETLREALG